MEPVRDAWTDERLDDLNRRVDSGFGELRGEMAGLRGEMAGLRGEMNELRREMNELRREWNERFESLERRLDSVQRTMTYGFLSMSAAMIAALGAITTQI